MPSDNLQTKGISIHAPREGSDPLVDIAQSSRFLFQSTLPVRGATASVEVQEVNETISIHAPREGSDVHGDFQSALAVIFQSTLPVRGATGWNLTVRLPITNFNPRSP